MKNATKFLNAIDYKPSKIFLNGSFRSYNIKKDSEDRPIIEVEYEFSDFLPIEEYILYEKKCNDYKHKIINTFKIKNRSIDIDVVYDYIKHILDKNNFMFGNSLRHNDLKVSNNLKIKSHSNDSLNGWEKNKLNILNDLNKIGFLFSGIEVYLSNSDPLARDELKLRNKINKFSQEKEIKEKMVQFSQEKKTPTKSTNIKISDIDDDAIHAYNGMTISFTAEVVAKPEVVDIKSKNLMIYNLILTDHYESVKGTFFYNPILSSNSEIWKKTSHKSKTKLYKEVISKIKPGMILNVAGKIKHNIRNNEIFIDISDAQETSNIFTTNDHEQVKRVEFHLHTKMSSQDGINSPSDYINKAIEWGHDAIAITDHDSLQAFPEAYNNIRWDKNNAFKIIYGMEASMIDLDKTHIIKNVNENMNLDKDTYIFFDLETTGLSSRFNDIIEFGAVKIKNHKVIEKKQIFIKPKNPIPQFISDITNITNEDVENSPSLSECINEIKDWIGDDSILVAHNADFDISFLNQAYRENKINEIKNPIIDTMKLSWSINKIRNHKLGTIAKYYNIPYDSAIAHRADYDAEILSLIYFDMQQKLEGEEKFNVKSFEELSKNNINNIFPNHITIYAKNQKGLKQLYDLVSLGHSEYLGKTPRIPKQEIIKRRENLIIGSACDKGEVFEKIAMNTMEIDTISDFYDFFEIMPLDSLTHLIDKQILTKDQIIKVNQDIYKLSKKKNKLAIATGNVHYMNPQDKKIRDVLVHNKGLGGSFHPLFDFKNRIKEIPNNYFRTTRKMKESFTGVFSKEIIKEIVINNTRELSSIFEIVKPIPDKLYPPKINKNPGDKLTKLIYKNSEKIYGPKEKWDKIISDRVKKELDSIIKHGYAEIYLISAEIVQDSIDNGYLVGSRGSVGSSIIATFSNITEVNPLPAHYVCSKDFYIEFNSEYDCGYDLPDKKCPKCGNILTKEGHDIPFETFLGFEGDKIPDIDLNFAREYQLKSHDYTRKMFGKNNVFRAGTISTLASQTAYGFVMNWAEKKGLKESLSKSEMERIRTKIIGSRKTTGQHPGGLIIVPDSKSIHDFTPVNHPANDKSEHKTTHFDFHAIHDNLLKLDLLGHLDPSAIKMLQNITGVDPKQIPHFDKKVLDIFNSLDTLGIKSEQISGEVIGTIGIPEFGTKFVREMLSDTKPKSFADLVRISGLSHGTDVWLNNAKDLILSSVIKLKDAIACRDDIMIYLMKKGLDSQLSFNIMENVRKGKGLSESDEKEMKSKHVEDWYINSCKTIKYMFPKAHATAYVLMAWRIAWFKVYYPLEYYATFFTTRCDFFDVHAMEKGANYSSSILDSLKEREDSKRKPGLEPLTVKDKGILTSLESTLELYARGFKIEKINIQKSLSDEWIINKENNSLIPPFSTIDGLGDTMAKRIITSRNNMKDKLFTTREEFIQNTGINNTVLNILDEYGLFKDIRDSNQLSIFDFE